MVRIFYSFRKFNTPAKNFKQIYYPSCLFEKNRTLAFFLLWLNFKGNISPGQKSLRVDIVWILYEKAELRLETFVVRQLVYRRYLRSYCGIISLRKYWWQVEGMEKSGGINSLPIWWQAYLSEIITWNTPVFWVWEIRNHWLWALLSLPMLWGGRRFTTLPVLRRLSWTFGAKFDLD